MQPSDAVVTWAAAFAALWTVTTAVLGFLLNRLFGEIDRLKNSEQALARAISALAEKVAGSTIDRPAFDRHVEREEAELSRMRAETQAAIVNLRKDMAEGIRALREDLGKIAGGQQKMLLVMAKHLGIAAEID